MLAPLLLAPLVLGSAPAAPASTAAPKTTPAEANAKGDDDDWADRPFIRHPMPAPTFLLPGFQYVSWSPLSGGDAHVGAGFELSITKWLPRSSFVLGALAQVEHVGRARAALGFEVGYDVVGLEIALARDFAKEGAFDAQWSAQLATYVSVGALYVSPRWLLPIARSGDRSPGFGAMLAVGLKLPVVLDEGHR
jgi:hypothetical protein